MLSSVVCVCILSCDGLDPAIITEEAEDLAAVGFIQVTGITDLDIHPLPSLQIIL